MGEMIGLNEDKNYKWAEPKRLFKKFITEKPVPNFEFPLVESLYTSDTIWKSLSCIRVISTNDVGQQVTLAKQSYFSSY